MKKIVCLVFVMMSALTANAQWTISPEAGITAVNRANMNDDTWSSGWKVGVGVEYQVTSLFSLKSGIHYTQRGWKNDFMPWFDAEDNLHISTIDNKRHFLQVPLLAQAGFNLGNDVRLNLAAGPYVGYCIHHSYGHGTYSDIKSYGGSVGYGYGYGGSVAGSGKYNPFSGIRSFDWGASFAVGLEVKRLYFNVGYDLSLGKEYKNDNKEVDAKYHTLSLTVGYKFKL